MVTFANNKKFMAYKDLQQFIDALDRAGELIRVKEYVNPHHEITEITDRLSKSDNNKALLFENTGYDFPLLINSTGLRKQEMAFYSAWWWHWVW